MTSPSVNGRWLPASILLTGAMIAVALYAALKPQPSDAGRAIVEELAPASAPQHRESPFAHRERAVEGVDAPTSPVDRNGIAEAPRAREREDGDLGHVSEPAVLATPPIASSEVVSRVRDDAARALSDARSEIRSSCWDAIEKDEGAPSEVPLGLSLGFDSSGKVVATGVSESRDAALPGVADCVRSIVHGLEVAAPGANVNVELSITVP